jgi:hypothetical protein
VTSDNLPYRPKSEVWEKEIAAIYKTPKNNNER